MIIANFYNMKTYIYNGFTIGLLSWKPLPEPPKGI